MSTRTAKQLAYDWYRTTQAWRDRRNACLRRSNGRCQICGRQASQAHHKSYANIFAEKPEDLMALCANCHAEIHFKAPANDNQLELPLETKIKVKA